MQTLNPSKKKTSTRKLTPTCNHPKFYKERNRACMAKFQRLFFPLQIVYFELLSEKK